MIFVSTGGFNLSGINASRCLLSNDINHIELSGGMIDENQTKELIEISSKCNFQVHNYFPPPNNPFVLNLASSNNETYDATYNHIFSSIDLAKKLGSNFYSFHAGFLLDPGVNELGKRFNKQNLQNRDKGKDLFVKRVNEVSQYANQKGIKILLENNVISSSNYDSLGENPFLMTHHHEIIEIMESTDENVGLLVDLAHLKVSANTEKFCKFEFLEATTEYTDAYHLSDNNGLADTNSPISTNSWFWPYINKNLNYYTLEVYNQNLDIIQDQLRIIHSTLFN